MDVRPVDTLWVLICSGLVFTMQAGFLCLEAGFTRSKNSINVALKNLTDFAVSVAGFWAVGFALMFGESSTGWVGATHFFVSFHDGVWVTTFFLFQLMFCGTAVTIVSGAVAERMRFFSYLFVALVGSTLVYPMLGHWAWGGALEGERGWLAARGFVDFAGSTVVHSVGGTVSLAALFVIGPRMGRFVPGEPPRKISGSNVPMSMLGVLLLWLGWIGFNGGSTLALDDRVPSIIANTMLAGGFGLGAGLLFSLWRGGYPSVEHTANGSLAGLVAITANCHAVEAGEAAIIGSVGAVVMILVQDLLDYLRLDDAVGAVPVHLGAGMWGTVAVALFGDEKALGTGLDFWAQLGIQCLGVVSSFVWTFTICYLLFSTVNRFWPMRVTPSQETVGLNVVEHHETTEAQDLLHVMNVQAETHDLSLRAPVDAFTDVGQIAKHYNRVVDALQTAAVEMQAIVRTAKDGIVTFARDSLEVLSVNPSAELIFGIPSSSLVGQSFWSLVEPKSKSETTLDQILRESDRGATSELRGKRSDNTTFPVEVILTQAEVKDRWIYVGTFRDVSQNRELEDRLRQAQKMEGIGQLAGGIAHDFNNLLTVITGFTEVSRLRTEPGTPLHDSLSQVLSAGERAAALTKQLLAFSRRKPSKREFLDLPDVVEGMHKMMHRLIGSDVELLFKRSEAMHVNADRGELEQVVMNLVVNARDAMPNGGKLSIEVSVRRLEEEDPLLQSPSDAGEYVVLSVADTGLGMDPMTRQRIFEPFFTTKDVDKGTGLGLAVVYGIVTHARGFIQVESEPGRGTTFNVFWPRAPEETPAPSTRPEEQKSVGGDETILVVEDEERLCKLIEHVLTESGYAVLTANNGRDALALAASHPGRIDLLLTDVVMPQMRGSELAQKLAELRPTLSILFMSGYVEEEQREDLLLRGEFIQKPFVTSHLSRKIRDLLDRRRSTRPRAGE